MKFIYACDIHGDERKYEKLLEQAKNQNIKHIVLGGDLLPKMCEIHTNVFNIDNKRVDIEDVSFIGLSKVLDHPFGCKDRVVIENGLRMPMRLSYKINKKLIRPIEKLHQI